MRSLSLAFGLIVVSLAGCLGADDVDPKKPDLILGPHLGVDDLPQFSLPKIIDPVRSGGEPVIAITQEGTILISSHPGYTHVRPNAADPASATDLVVPTQGQSYLWRSTDDGATWTHVSILPPTPLPNSGPRGAGTGVSDPEFTIDGNGRIWTTDLEGLAMASVSWSDDDGASWIQGNPLGSQEPIDRQWLASFGDTMYFTGNYMATPDVVYATKDGLTYEERGRRVCAGDSIAHPGTGTLYTGCGTGLAVSKDGARTWEKFDLEDVEGYDGPITNEPALDTAGNIYLAGTTSLASIWYAVTSDEGQSFRTVQLKPFFPDLADGTFTFPWVSAGTEGRIGVSFFGSPIKDAQKSQDAPWYLYTAIILSANTVNPEIYPIQVTPEPVHLGGMCQGGTTCQATTTVNKANDRRLGDFFESTVDAQGRLHISYANTAAYPNDAVSHVAYVRLEQGPLLVDGDVPTGFPTQG